MFMTTHDRERESPRDVSLSIARKLILGNTWIWNIVYTYERDSAHYTWLDSLNSKVLITTDYLLKSVLQYLFLVTYSDFLEEQGVCIWPLN